MDDPLGDLSDDDSFFDSKKPIIRRGSTPKPSEKKSITDIFNITEKDTQKKPDDWLGLSTPTKEVSDFDIKKSPVKLNKKISFEDDDEILSNLGLDKKTGVEKSGPSSIESKAKRSDLLGSILGPSKIDDKKLSFDDILKESKAKTQDTKSIEDKKLTIDSILKPKFEESTPNVVQGETIREGRRGRRSSGALLDPLGLFSTSEAKEKVEDIDVTKSSTMSIDKHQAKSTSHIPETGIPDWLAGAATRPSKSEGALVTSTITPEPSKTKITEDVSIKDFTPNPINAQLEDNELKTLLTQQKLTQFNVEYQNTAMALQQQESQVLMSLQLKRYEEKLAEMQLKQQEVLMKQEQNFNNLLERQFAKQQIMENNLRLQQERINNHIQMLIAQPPLIAQPEEINGLKKSMNDDGIKLYENMVNTLKQRQHEEIFLLEESYKKQITLLEESLSQIENRLKSDIDKINKNYEDKIEAMTKEHEVEITKYKQKLQEIEERHLEEMKQIRDNHMRVVDEVKYEYSSLIENMKQTRQSETNLLNDSDSYMKKLDSNIQMLMNNSVALQQMKGNVEKHHGILSEAREEHIKSKEAEIILMREALEKCRATAEEERSQLLGLVRTLEMKIAETNQNSREDRWALQQAASTLAAKSAALDREIEFSRTSIERERKQLETTKASMLAEQEKLIMQLNEEKLTLSAEKSRSEVSHKLSTNYDIQRNQIEVEAAIQVAREATEMTDREREKLQRQQCEVEKLKRILTDKERQLNLKELDLDNVMREAQMKLHEGERALSESKSIESRYNDRLRELQSQLTNVATREKKVAEEKIAVSKERVALYTLLRQKRKCGLCELDNKVEGFDIMLPPSYFGGFQDMNTEVTRLRLEEIDLENPLPKPENHN